MLQVEYFCLSKRILRQIAALIPVCAVAFSASAVFAESITLPIHQSMMPNGELRYSTPISLNGSAPIEAMIDTGSVGLRILQIAYAGNKATMPVGDGSVTADHYAYVEGVAMIGTHLQTSVSIGRTGDMPIQLVSQVTCPPGVQRCPASGMLSSEYRIGGEGYVRAGFYAILGIGGPIDAGGLPNPLQVLGYRNWTIELPTYGAAEPGKLTLYADDAPVDQFTALAPDAQGRVAGCMILADGKTVCAPTTLDTGSPGVDVYLPNVSQPRIWRAGIKSMFGFANINLPAAEFVSGARGTFTHVALRPLDRRQQTVIDSGILPYFRYVMLYDAQGRIAGARLR